MTDTANKQIESTYEEMLVRITHSPPASNVRMAVFVENYDTALSVRITWLHINGSKSSSAADIGQSGRYSLSFAQNL